MLLATAGELRGEGCWVILGLRWDVKGDMISMKTNLLSQKQQLTPQPTHANENRERDSVDSLSPVATANVNPHNHSWMYPRLYLQHYIKVILYTVTIYSFYIYEYESLQRAWNMCPSGKYYKEKQFIWMKITIILFHIFFLGYI